MKHALQVLEFEEIRRRLAHECEMEIAVSMAADLTPAFAVDQVWLQLEATAEAHRLLAGNSPPSLGAVRDLRDSLNRASKGGALGGQELFQIAEAIAAMRAWRSFMNAKRADYPRCWEFVESFPELKLLEEQLFASIDPSGEVLSSASPELARLRQRKQTIGARILDKIQSYTSGKFRDLLSDPIYTMRDGRYVVPVKAENRGKVRGIVHDTSGSGQTVYVEPEEVLQLGNQLREAEVAEREEILRILGVLSAKVGASGLAISVGIDAAGELDFLLSKARLAFAMKGTEPRRSQGHGLIVEGGRHPLLESEKVVPLSLSVGFEFDGLLITGPNTGGKTVAIKTVGLFVLMAQSGLFLPAIDVRIGPFTQVWADIGDEQSLQQSLSTFSGHIRNIAEALQNVRKGALVLFDEIGAGTDPAEGAALAKAILLELQGAGATIIASTHYGELKAFAYTADRFRNAAMEFDPKTLRPTYRLVMGAPGASHALKIAERYGLPRKVIDRALEGLSEEQQEIGQMFEKLESAQRLARLAQGEADRRAHELKVSESRASEKLREAEEVRKNVYAKASAAVDEALREIRAEAAKIFEDLKSGPVDQKAIDAARKKLKDLQEYGGAVRQEFEEPKQKAALGTQIAKGMSVRVEGYNQIGVVLSDPKAGTVQVQLGVLKLTVPVGDVIPKAAEPYKDKARTNLGFQRAQTAATEVHLRAMRAEDAIEQLEKFVDDAVLAGLPSVRIVHGKGEGILRKITQEFLKKNRDVKSFRDGEPAEGGQGVTIAVLK